MNLRKDWVFSFRIVLVGLSLSAFISQFLMGWLDLRYFTDQSNLGVLVWLLCAIFCHKNVNLSQKLKGVFRGAVTLYLTFTFLIFSTLLYDGTMTYSSLIFHYLLPIVFLFEWVLTESEKQYQWRYVGAWIIYPLVYLV